MAASLTAALVDPYVREWLDLLLRSLHVIAGIVWIGTSFYFVALDHHLTPARDGADVDKGVGGEAWEIHGGGFYLVQKYRVAPQELPETLYWFKWEAYTTWLSGFALLVVFYYLDAETYLVDANVADIPVWAAIAVSLAGLAVAWLAYDLLCRVVRDDRLVLVAVVVLTAAAAWGAGQLLSPRAALLQVGAMLGTVMVANVFFNIIPAHWEVVRAKEQGRAPDAAPGLEAKRRSVHNNYLTLPVVLTMIGNHFPFVYAHEHAWLVAVALMALGAWIRHFFNLRHRGNTVWW
nr:urate hydroxylase PuuD [Actinomycetota bacterium]